MANHASAKKRARQSEKKRVMNRHYKTAIRNLEKQMRKMASEEEKKQEAVKKLSLFNSQIDRAVKKGVLHKNTANRKKSQLAKFVNNT